MGGVTVTPGPTRVAHGGKTVYGARVGLLMLETKFPRVPGDVGNAATWPFPVLYRVVHGASAERVVHQGSKGMLEPFLAAAEELVADGADGIATSCGFLALFQKEMRARLKVPVATSSLLQVPFVQSLLPPGRRVGVITVSVPHLTADHLRAVDVPLDTPIIGCNHDGEFFTGFAGDRTTIDMAAAERDMLAAGDELRRRHPEVGAIVLECTNMLPFARALRDHSGLPVYDAYSLISWFHAGLAPRDFGHPGSAPRPWRER